MMNINLRRLSGFCAVEARLVGAGSYSPANIRQCQAKKALWPLLCSSNPQIKQSSQCHNARLSHTFRGDITLVSDETQFGPKSRRQLKQIVSELTADFEVAGGRSGDVDDAPVFVDSTPTPGGVTWLQQEEPRPKDGQHCVLGLDTMMELLVRENAQDICVIELPPEKNYAQYFMVCCGKSIRHLKAMAEQISIEYKNRRASYDKHVLIEGRDSEDWICMDFGNIVIHFMMPASREVYELEKLWCLGAQYDEQVQHHHEEMRRIEDELAVDVDDTDDTSERSE